MKFPIIVEAGVDKARVSQVVIDYARQVHQYCDLLIDGDAQQGVPALPAVDLKVFGGLVTTAIRLRAELTVIEASGKIGAFARSIRQQLESKVGRDFLQSDVNQMLLDIKAALDAFVPAAVAAQPVDAETGCLLLYVRDPTTLEIGPYVYDPADPTLQSLITDLRAGFEGAPAAPAGPVTPS